MELGHLLVTIDDFESLIKQVHSYAHENLTISFIGGHIDEADDLRSLTDAELAHLKIQSTNVTIELARTSAIFSGPRDMANQIQKWSSSRQRRWTGRRRVRREISNGLAASYMVPSSLLVVITALAFIASIPIALFSFLANTTSAASTVGQMAAIAGLVPLAWIYYHHKRTRKITSSCAVAPLSRDEYRRDRITQNRQTVTWAIATLAIVATLIATQLKK